MDRLPVKAEPLTTQSYTTMSDETKDMDNELNDAATAPQQGAQDDATTNCADATTAHSDYHPAG